jgi:hypothetical protein
MYYNNTHVHWTGPLAIVWIATVGVPTAQQSHAPKTIYIHTDRAPVEPEATDIGERLRQVDAAIVAQVLWNEVRAERLHAKPGRPPGPLGDIPDSLTTENVVTVREVLKGHSQMPTTIGSSVRISQPLGETIWNGYKVVRDDGRAKALQPKAEYVLLLKWNPYSGMFTLRADDIFRISSGHVETPSSARFGLANAGSPAQEFMTRLRTAAAQLRK